MQPETAHPEMVPDKQTLLLRSLVPFFSNTPNAHARLKMLTKSGASVSLRTLDDFVNKFCPLHPEYQGIYDSHLANLKAYGKERWDFFRRKHHVRLDDATDTTVGQLNILRWAHLNGVLDLAAQHRDEVARLRKSHSERHSDNIRVRHGRVNVAFDSFLEK